MLRHSVFGEDIYPIKVQESLQIRSSSSIRIYCKLQESSQLIKSLYKMYGGVHFPKIHSIVGIINF